MRFRLLSLMLFFALSACSDVPDLDNAISQAAKSADFPTLVPFETLLVNVNQTVLTGREAAAFKARMRRLQRRAARLRTL